MSAKSEYSRTRFGFDVFNFLPQGHEKALKQAFYNTAAIVLVIVVFIAAVAVYFVLEPFLRPLLWALLFGSVLHPFKSTLADIFRNWLNGLQAKNTPLVVGVIVIPFDVVDRMSESMIDVFLKYKKLLIMVSTGIPTLLLLYHFLPHTLLLGVYNALFTLIQWISAILEFFSSVNYLVWTVVIGYLLAIYFWWTPYSKQVLSKLSIVIWTVLTCHVATIAGSLRVPILLVLIILMMMGFITELKAKHARDISKESSDAKVQAATTPLMTVQASLAWLTGTPVSSPGRELSYGHSNTDIGTAGLESTPNAQIEDSTPEKSFSVAKPSSISLPGKKEGSNIKETKGMLKEQQLSNMYLYCLLWACVIAQLWPHMWLLCLLPIALVYIVAKKVGSHFGLWNFLSIKFNVVWNVCCNWCESRKDALVPSPIRGLWRLLAQGDKMVTVMLEGSIDTFTSIAVISIVFVLTVVGTIFLAVQIYGESMHLVGVTSSLINQTVVYNSDLQDLLPEGLLDVEGTLDSVLGDAYMYGREWISTSVKRLIDEKDDVRAAALEKQILEVWDRVYHLWVSRNVNDVVFDNHHPSASFDNLVDGLKTLNVGLLINFVKENIGTLMKVLDSVWIVLKGNISLALSILTATISLVFGGGTAVLNFILNFVVFSTALFYLLCASGNKYKPQEAFSQMLPSTHSGAKLGTAIEEAINGVFAVSFKMAAFYGMYTWLIHTVFDVKIIYIPSVLAAVFGAVPFLGAYWACLPAVLELWLVQGRIGIAGLMLAFQLIPTSFVDSAIYSEIKGGGHPYITGLAIAGGVFCLGFEGALFGPLLLCFFFVAVNMYSSMMQDTPVSEASHPASRHPFKRMFTID